MAATARELLTRPVPDFPAEAIPIAVADIILERTGGHPYLLQLYASLLVAFLNDEKHRQACLEDVTTVEATVRRSGRLSRRYALCYALSTAVLCRR